MTATPPEPPEPTEPTGATPGPGAPPPRPPATDAGARGPLGQPRPIALTLVLVIITCGIYGLYWQYKTFDELQQHNGTGLGGVLGLILAIFIGIVNVFILPAEIKNTYEADGRESPVSPVHGLWVLLPLIGYIIWFVKVQGALNDYWVSKGATPA